MVAPEPRGAALLPTQAAVVLPGVPVLVVAASRARRARAGTKTVHWGQRVQGEVWAGVWLVLVGAWAGAWAEAWAEAWARLYRSTFYGP